MRQAVDDVAGVLRGRLDVGMVSGCTITPLFDALAAFGAAHPGIEISLIEDSSERLTERVRAGQVRRGPDRRGGPHPRGLEAFTIVSERLVAAAPAGHPLARRRDTCTLAEVVGHPLVCMPQGPACARYSTPPARGVGSCPRSP